MFGSNCLILFADDTTLYYSHKDSDETAKVLNQELVKWPVYKLSLNMKKTSSLVFDQEIMISL